MNRTRWIKFLVLLLVVFAGGAATGVLLDRHFVRRASARAGEPARTPAQILATLDEILKLAPDQKTKIGVILDEFGQERAAHPEWTRLDRWRALVRASVRIRPLLTAEQAPIFDQAMEQLRPRRAPGL